MNLFLRIFLQFSSVNITYFFNINVPLMIRMTCAIRVVDRVSNGVVSALG